MADPPTTAIVSGWLGASVVICYLAALLGLGVAGRWATPKTALSEFFLAGRGLGSVVLLLTLFATQYSGNTLLGFAGAAYRQGYFFVVAVPYMLAIIAVAIVIAPGLHRIGTRNDYVTLVDAVHGRFGNRTLSVLVAFICVWALSNFILTNLIAVGLLVERATGGGVDQTTAMIALALVMVVYETLGGLRAVAWTDVLQGALIGAGVVAITVAIVWVYGGPQSAYDSLASQSGELIAAPTIEGKINWISTILLVGIGAAIYPHAVQRYYAARSAAVLRRSLAWMLLMPFLVVTFSVMIGVLGRSQFADLGREQSDEVALILLADLVSRSPAMLPIIVIFVTAVMAAIMSSIDSVLLALSATLTRDLYAPLRGPGVSDSHLTWVGKCASWVIMAVAVLAAIMLDETIWRLVQIKLEVLLQAAPAVWLAVYGPRVRPRPVIVGLIAGSLIALLPLGSELIAQAAGGTFFVSETWHGVHMGVIGLAVNTCLIAGLSRLESARASRPSGVPART